MASSFTFCSHCGAANLPGMRRCFACSQSLTDRSKQDTVEATPQPLLLNRYRIVSQVGIGGFGAVYKAEDMQRGRRFVAVKEINLRGLSPKEMIEATDTFNREVQLLTGLSHPNLPSMYDSATDSEHWYLIMEFIPGTTLEDAITSTANQCLTVDEVLDIGMQLCTVLDYLHMLRPPIIFRDLKPANIMRTPSGHIYLIDFGIARHFKPGQAKDTMILGSPGFAAPEQYGKAQTTPAADMYSLGATLHALLSGIDPSETPFQFTPLSHPIPTELATLIAQMVELDASKRPAGMLSMKQELQRIFEERAALRRIALHHYPLALGKIPTRRPPPIVGALSRRTFVRGAIGLAAVGITGTGIISAISSLARSSSYSMINTGPAPFPLIKIASDLSVSGIDAESGKPVENGVRMAIDEANANQAVPGYMLQFASKDDVSHSEFHDAASGRRNVIDFINDAMVAGIIGPIYSDVAQKEMSTANDAPIALISPTNTYPCLTEDMPATGCSAGDDLLPTLRPTGNTTYFRLATPDNYQAEAMARYLLEVVGYHKAYMLDDTEFYSVTLGKSFLATWQQAGGTILGQQSLAPTTTSYVEQLTQIATLQPDLIYFGGFDTTGGILLRQQMLQIPTLKHAAFAGGDGIMTSMFAATTGLSGGPSYATASNTNRASSSSMQRFAARYNGLYRDNALFNAARGYDSANILIAAIKTALVNGARPARAAHDLAQARMFRQAVINAVKHIYYDGVTGHYSFDANGDAIDKSISVYQLVESGNTASWRIVAEVKM